jgi:predicted metal-dependent TIM-barrel fold hydrolase
VFDARLYPAGLSDHDLQTLRFFEISHVLAVALPPPAPITAASLTAQLTDLLEVQLPRLAKEGLQAWAALGVSARSLPRRGLPEVLAALPKLLRHPRARIIGPLELWRGGESEEEAFVEQLKLARRLRLPVWVAASNAPRDTTTRRALQLLMATHIEPAKVLFDGATARTVKLIRACGYTAGLTIHPDGLKAEEAVALVKKLGAEGLALSTAAGEGATDLLGLARTAHLLQKAGLSRAVVSRVTFDNAAALLEAGI